MMNKLTVILTLKKDHKFYNIIKSLSVVQNDWTII